MPGRNSMAMIGWLNLCNRKDLDPKETLLKGIEPLQQNVTDYNSFKHLFGHYDAQWAISIGKYLNQMKKMAKRAGYMWEPWAAENLPFIGEDHEEQIHEAWQVVRIATGIRFSGWRDWTISAG